MGDWVRYKRIKKDKVKSKYYLSTPLTTFYSTFVFIFIFISFSNYFLQYEYWYKRNTTCVENMKKHMKLQKKLPWRVLLLSGNEYWDSKLLKIEANIYDTTIK